MSFYGTPWMKRRPSGEMDMPARSERSMRRFPGAPMIPMLPTVKAEKTLDREALARVARLWEKEKQRRLVLDREGKGYVGKLRVKK